MATPASDVRQLGKGIGDVARHLTGHLSTFDRARADSLERVETNLCWINVNQVIMYAESIGWKGKCMVCEGPMPVSDIHFECY